MGKEKEAFLEAFVWPKETTEPRVLIVMPAFNEAANIARVLKKVRAIVPGADILVIDDGSTDCTAYLAKQAGAAVVCLPFNMGYGAACQTGFKYACRQDYDYVVQMDADGQHEPRCILDLLAAAMEPDVDVVLGSRWLGLGDYHGPLLRKFGKFFFGFLAGLVTQHEVTDPTTGFQALTRPVLRFFCSNVYPVDYPDADVIIMLDRAGFRVKEVPVVMYRDESGQSMHRGLLRPIYYGMKMMLSIGMTLLRDDRVLLRQLASFPIGRGTSETAQDYQETVASGGSYTRGSSVG
jgi:glycosyltransferase involved in cell wall biosynthesis